MTHSRIYGGLMTAPNPDPFATPQPWEQQKPSPPTLVVWTLAVAALVALVTIIVSAKVFISVLDSTPQSYGLTQLSNGKVASASEVSRLQLASLQVTLANFSIIAMIFLLLFHADSQLRKPLRIALTTVMAATPIVATAIAPRWGGAMAILTLLPTLALLTLLWLPAASQKFFGTISAMTAHAPGQQQAPTNFYPGESGTSSTRSDRDDGQQPSRFY